MSLLKTIKAAYPLGSLDLARFYAILKLVKTRGAEIPKLLLILASILLGYNLSLAQPGSLDTSFDPGTGANGPVLSTSIQSDGKIIIAGDFTSYNGMERNRIARLNTDGSLDTSFVPGTGDIRWIYTTAIQNDGKVIIGGNIVSYNRMTKRHIARLNTDGSLDSSFDSGTGPNSWVYAISIQSDGKIILAGQFISYNGASIRRIARLNTDGSIDTSFDPGSGPNTSVTSTSLQSDGKIIIGGYFHSYNGTEINGIARLNTDGSLDTSFDPGIGDNNRVRTTSIQSDGKIIIGGNLTSYNGTEINGIARLNPDGILDTSFDSGTGANQWVLTTSLQSDGKIIIGGDFTSFNGTEINGIARLNTNGSLDSSFDPGMEPDSLISTTSIQSDGRIIVGGSFSSYNGTPINNIARLYSTNPTAVIHPLQEESKSVKIIPNPFSNTTTLHSDIHLKNASLTIFNSIGQSVKQISPINIAAGDNLLLNRDHLPAGLYFIQLSQENQIIANDKLVITD